jgi:hypothetical protein
VTWACAVLAGAALASPVTWAEEPWRQGGEVSCADARATGQGRPAMDDVGGALWEGKSRRPKRAGRGKKAGEDCALTGRELVWSSRGRGGVAEGARGGRAAPNSVRIPAAVASAEKI